MSTFPNLVSFPRRALAFLAAFGAYVHLCFVVAVVIGLVGMARWHPTTGAAFLALYIAVWAGSAVIAALSPKRYGSIALWLTAVPMLFITVAWLGRIAFLLRHGGMDCSTCDGSPLVFLYQWCIESAFLIAGLVSASSLLYAVRSHKFNT